MKYCKFFLKISVFPWILRKTEYDTISLSYDVTAAHLLIHFYFISTKPMGMRLKNDP